jgi:heptosyltransferase I
VSIAAVAPRSVLVVRLGAMGDVIHTIPAVSALRDVFPDTRIGWVVEQRWAELLCAKDAARSGPRNPSRPLIDFVHVVDTKTWRKSLLSVETRRQIAAARREVRDQQYEVAIDFQGALKSAAFARLAGTRTVIGMQHPREWPSRMFYTTLTATRERHVIEQYHALAEAVAGRSLAQCPAQFPHDDRNEASVARLIAPGEQFVVINPGAGWGAKQWPAKNYGEVAKALSAAGLTPLINFGPGEEQLANVVEKASQGAARRISCSIGELIALTSRARLFIGGDTGPLHLAAALQVPVLAIFGPTDPMRNGPHGTRSIVLRNPASRSSLSHTSEPDPGLLNITPDEVISAARSLLEESAA